MTRAEAKQRTRAGVLDAAAAVFARKGFGGATMQEIAEEAGRTTGAIYAHFAGKDDLFFALLDREQSERLATFSAFASADGDIIDRFATWFERDVDRWDLLRLEFWRYAIHKPELAVELSRRRQVEHAGMAEIFEFIYRKNGSTPPLPPQDLAKLVLAITDGLRALRRADPSAPIRALFTYAISRVMTSSSNVPDRD